ncbi:MAG: hypothetical protein Q8R37_01845 [Nanoarchaeota archaeon]|nr:hypothetical protein [Nanoarchaeota archaeon]
MDNIKNLDEVIDEALWEFRAINAGILPTQIVTHHSEHYYSIHYDRDNVDLWIEQQKLLERKKKRDVYDGNVSLLENKKGELSSCQDGNLSIIGDATIREQKSLLTKIKQLYQAARQYLSR